MQAPKPVETHGPLLGAAASWFVMLSPLSGLLVGLLGVWLAGQQIPDEKLEPEDR
jgi:hypothetical protein